MSEIVRISAGKAAIILNEVPEPWRGIIKSIAIDRDDAFNRGVEVSAQYIDHLSTGHSRAIRDLKTSSTQGDVASNVDADVKTDAIRYRHLRHKDVDTIYSGGVFAGQTPQNYVLNKEDLDQTIDAEMAGQKANTMKGRS